MKPLRRITLTLLSVAVLMGSSATLTSAATPTVRALQRQASQTRDNGGSHFEPGAPSSRRELRASLLVDSPIVEANSSMRSRIQELVQQAREHGSVRN
ncbi:hypothetical protein L1047_08890 [Synechococcus sp. Nb3U1]|uniref:hypothetical protein n=1 Tax=Synechococcus sp. Nb3U1 TaxID=1914529 RepID=UPI001F35FBE6|nr:hypothetical protein [Synechococcus sp. Nb3U1]MCF2971309.1 hypothetical protein [Synechococcus sp. Nb3U1]